MKLANRLVVFFLFTFIAQGAVAKSEALSDREYSYIEKLNEWISNGGDPDKIQTEVVATCSNLVMETATWKERITFLLYLDLDTFDARVFFCAHAVVNTVYPQAQFKKKDWLRSACSVPARAMKVVCSNFVTMPETSTRP